MLLDCIKLIYNLHRHYTFKHGVGVHAFSIEYGIIMSHSEYSKPITIKEAVAF